VMVAPIEEGDPRPAPREGARGVEPAESAADDDHVRPPLWSAHGAIFRGRVGGVNP
jgi:hypothetical protein